jgi:hypothetical protein
VSLDRLDKFHLGKMASSTVNEQKIWLCRKNC